MPEIPSPSIDAPPRTRVPLCVQPKMNGHANGNGNGSSVHEDLTAGELYNLCLEAKPMFGSKWFSVLDTASRLGLAIFAFYRFLLLQPIALLRFAYSWNTLWCANPPAARTRRRLNHRPARPHATLSVPW